VTIFELAGQKDFLVTSELIPPKGPKLKDTLITADQLAPLVDALNVPDGPGGSMRMGSLPLCHHLIQKDIEPVFQITCRDRNRIALQSELLNASGLGIRNILCLTGDHVFLGDHPDAKPVFDLDSVSLLSVAQKLNRGVDMGGNTLNASTALCPGGVVNPNAMPVEPHLLKMERKIQAGALFFQTQAVFEPPKILPFAQLAQDRNIPLLMGVMILKNPAMAKFVKSHIAGIDIPENFIAELENAKDPTQKGLEMAAGIICRAKDMCQGVHIMAGGDAQLVHGVLKKAGIL
jgi:5,10-methylenetetrahydrofolate reductase